MASRGLENNGYLEWPVAVEYNPKPSPPNIMYSQKLEIILSEIRAVLTTVDEAEVEHLVSELLSSRRVVGVGAGRVGMAVRAFMMRLGHFGLDAHTIGDSTVPGIGAGDICFAASGSGETQTIVDLVTIAKKNQAKVILVTGNPDSRMGKLADVILRVKAPSKVPGSVQLQSIQPMTTLNEQCLGLLFDTIVLLMMEKMGETHDTMWARHSNLE